MADDKPKRGLTEKQWAEVRKAYESGESVNSLSKRYNIRRPTIDGRRDRENWTVQAVTARSFNTTVQKTVHARTQAQVIDMTSRRVVDSLPESAVKQFADDLAAHAELSRLAAEASSYMLREFMDGNLKPGINQSKADVFRSVITGVKVAADLGREIHGVRPGVASAQNEDADGNSMTIEQRRLEPRQVAVGEKGRAVESA